MSLRTRLLLLVILAIIPAVCIEIYGEIELRATRQQEIRQDALRLMRLVAAEQQRISEGARELLVAFSAGPSIRSRDWAGCNEVAKIIRSRVEGYVNIGVASPDGNLLCCALPVPVGKDMQRRSFLQDMTPDNDLFVGTFHVGLITGVKVITYALPLRDAAGQVIAVAWANIDLDWLARHFADRFSSPNLTLLIADRDGIILVRLPNTQAWSGKFMGDAYMPLVRAADEGVVDTTGVDGEERIIAYSPMGRDPKGLYLGIGLSKAPYFIPIDSASRQKALLISLSLALALAAAWFAGNAFIRRPIESLLATTRRWQGGDFSARGGLTDRTSELGQLGQAFDEMAEAVERRERMQRDAEDALAQLNAALEQRVKDEIGRREVAQAALVQSQKIEAIGQLTSGVAHDFNNLLAAVMGNLELLSGRVTDPRGQRLLDGALRAAMRGAKLTEQLLAFSRQRHLEPKPFNINELVRGMNDLLAHTIGPTIGISRSLAPDLWSALADPSQVEVALLNLAINARDAMPLGGALLIETVNLPNGHPRLPKSLAGDFVMVAVSDTGIGMTEIVKVRAFEPFYTTKEVGKGTGLGLSMVYGVAQQSGGTAMIESEPGKGTTVALFLPRSAAAIEAPGAHALLPAGSALHRRGKILVVDDDRDVRDVTVAALEESGHEVTAVDSGRAALALVDRDGRFDLMVIDYAMPGINGAEVIARVRAKTPAMPAILVTGYADAGLAGLAPDVPVLRKPFRTDEMVAQVQSALAANVTASSGNIVPLSPLQKR